MYDPKIGRWISEDPIGFQAADANLYRYVANEPTNVIDPSGLQEKKDDGICVISKITLVKDKGDVPSSVRVTPSFGEIKGDVQLATLGAYNDTKERGSFQNVQWIVWEGKNMADCEITRYVVVTTKFGSADAVIDPLGSKGYVKDKKIGAEGSKIDGPRDHEIRPEKPTDLIVVADAPGLHSLKACSYPAIFEANYYEVAISKKDKKIKGQIWYDVVIKSKGPGKDGVIANEVMKTGSEISK